MSAGAEQPVDVPPQVLEFLEKQQTMSLATASTSGMPHATTLLYVNDGPTLYFWSQATSSTSRQVAQNPVVAFTIDQYTDDLNQTRGIQGVGECAVLLSGEQIARVADLFGQKFPSLAPGSTMSISFFRITATELQFIDNTGTPPAREGAFGAEFHRERSYSVIQAIPLKPAKRVSISLQPLEVASGETIVRQGAPADKFLILIEGEAEVLHDDQQIDQLKAGQLFGEVAIMRDQSRAATVKATTDARLLTIDREGFRELVAQSMEITPDFDKVIRQRLNASSAE
jgi:uncharacterized protein YhbP (UPF0306 family)